jgi:hypothetical protein
MGVARPTENNEQGKPWAVNLVTPKQIENQGALIAFLNDLKFDADGCCHEVRKGIKTTMPPSAITFRKRGRSLPRIAIPRRSDPS